MLTTKKLAAIALTGALSLTAVPALAQDSGTDTQTTQTETDREAEHADRKAERIARIAEALGMTSEAFTEAVDNVRAELEGTFDDDATRTERREAFKAAFSEETGIPVEDLEAAHEELKAERKAEALARLQEKLDEKVAAGEMTQEEADEIYAKAEESEGRPGRRGHGGKGHGQRGGASTDATADGTSA